MTTSESSLIHHSPDLISLPFSVEDFDKIQQPQIAPSALEELARKDLQGKLDKVRVGDFEIEPWKLKGMYLQEHSPESFWIPEVTDAKERMLLTQEAID